jgi:hypothetical protein
MTEIRGRCGACQAKFKVAAKYAGKKLRCPKCQAPIHVPQAEASNAPQAEASEPSGDESVSVLVPPPPPVAAPVPPATAPVPPAPANEAAAPLSEIRVVTSPRKTAARTVKSARKSSREKDSRRLTIVLALAGGCVALAIAAAIVLTMGQGSPAGPTGKVEGRAEGTAQKQANSPPSGEASAPPATAEPMANTPPVKAATASGEKTETRREIPGFEGWLQSFEAAQRAAAADKQDIVVVFGCSDTQTATQQLARTLDSPAMQQKLKSMQRVVIDFPQTPDGRTCVEDAGQNFRLQEQFDIARLPAMALADAEGRAYWVVQKWDAGFENLARQFAEWQKRKTERDELIAESKKGTPEDQLVAAIKVIEWLEEHRLWRFYAAEIGQWRKLAERVDPENKQGILESFFEPEWFLRVASVRENDGETAGKVAALLDPWIKRKFRDPDRGAKLHLLAARMLQATRRFDEATKQMQYAVDYRPLDTKLVEAVRDAKQILSNRDVLASGTGFLVATGGYVLTSHHVIEGDGKIVIRVAGVSEPIAASLIGKDVQRDLALLKVALPGTAKLSPLGLAANQSRRGAAVAGFGYPLRDTLGAGLKFSAGVVSAVPDETNNRYLLDLTVNPGSSGGPLCDRRGNVVGMISEKTSSGGIESSYALAIPSGDLIKFLEQNLPVWSKRADAAAGETELEWDKVDERVSSGVVMVVKKK